MIVIRDKRECCGCSACAQKCPQHCISMESDSEGFSYPKVDKDICTDCRLCERVCSFVNPYTKNAPLKTIAAINQDEETRKTSSSGGIFSLIAQKVINEGGIVFGAAFDEKWNVEITSANSLEELERMKGSKYVQADVKESYIKVEKLLKEDRFVLFSGTPCQVAGLKHFIGREYDNLLTVDIVCHGVPSPLLWSKYIKHITGNHLETIKSVDFRNKRKGWKDFRFVVHTTEDSGRPLVDEMFIDNIYMKTFLSNMSLRPSCFQCQAKGFSSKSDITIGDFWGIENLYPEMYDNQGTGVVFINSEKGMKYIDAVECKSIEVTYEEGVLGNFPVYCSVIAHPKRDNFMNEIRGASNITALMHRYTKPTLKESIKNQGRKIKHLLLQ